MLARKIAKTCGGSRAEPGLSFGPESRLKPVLPLFNDAHERPAQPTLSMQIEDVQQLPGMLSKAEVECLFHLGQFNDCQGAIVEIGSWKGKSTVALALGAAQKHNEKVYAIDPHTVMLEEGYITDTRSEFLNNLRLAGVADRVVPMIMTSEAAAQGWQKPVRLLWIDGDHRYASANLDFLLWEPHLAEGGILAMHDTIRKPGPKRVLWEQVFRSKCFQEIAIVDNITAVRKVSHASTAALLSKYATLALRGVYIAARKTHVPRSKELGRKALRRFTAQLWLTGN